MGGSNSPSYKKRIKCNSKTRSDLSFPRYIPDRDSRMVFQKSIQKPRQLRYIIDIYSEDELNVRRQARVARAGVARARVAAHRAPAVELIQLVMNRRRRIGRKHTKRSGRSFLLIV